MKNTLLAGALLVIGDGRTASASAQPPPLVTVKLVGNQIQADPDPVVVQRKMGRNVVIRVATPAGFPYDLRA